MTAPRQKRLRDILTIFQFSDNLEYIISGLLTYVKTFDLNLHKIKDMDSLPFIDVIKQIMEEKNLSQKAFADRLGINQTTVSQWLLGRKNPDSTALWLYMCNSAFRRTNYSD